MSRIDCHSLELHLAHACNLVCDNCSHFSNYRVGGLVPYADIEAWYQLWAPRIRPELFSLLGGEPLLHPKLLPIIRLTRDYWPDSELQLVSNGWLLDRHPDLPQVLADCNVRFEVSIHHDGPTYTAKSEELTRTLEEWATKYDIRVRVRPSHTTWRRLFRRGGRDILPYDDGEPETSWKNCASRWCMQLHEGRIWKCPPVAYIKQLDAKFGIDKRAWQSALTYVPLEASATDDEVAEFMKRETEGTLCGLCPANPELIRIHSPLPGTSEESPVS